jgi:hypothetical protein
LETAGILVNRNQAVDVLKEVLETADIIFPDALSLERNEGSKDFKVRIKTNDRDRPTVKEIAASRGLLVNEEKGTLIIC